MKMTKLTEALKDQFRVAGYLEDTGRIFLSEEKFLFDTRLEISIKFKTFLCTVVYFFFWFILKECFNFFVDSRRFGKEPR